jgi:hypothetical protein
VKRNGKYGRKVSWILKWFRKYGRNDRKNITNTETNSEKNRKIWNKGKMNSGLLFSTK